MFARNFKKNENGAAAVEFGFVVPVFIVFMLAIFYLGSTMMQMHSVRYALVKAARSVQLNSALTNSQIQTLVTNKVTELTGAAGVTVAVNRAGIVNGSALTTLTATYPVTFSVPALGTYTYNYSTVMTVTASAT